MFSILPGVTLAVTCDNLEQDPRMSNLMQHHIPRYIEDIGLYHRIEDLHGGPFSCKSFRHSAVAEDSSINAFSHSLGRTYEVDTRSIQTTAGTFWTARTTQSGYNLDARSIMTTTSTFCTARTTQARSNIDAQADVWQADVAAEKSKTTYVSISRRATVRLT